MPVILQAAIAAPAPEPQTRIAALGLAALDRLADLARLVRVVDRGRSAVSVPRSIDLVALERLEDGLAEVDATMVEGDGDLHAPESCHARRGRPLLVLNTAAWQS